jgi:hypothetical protein
LPAGGLAVERYLKEHVSKRGRPAGCPLTNPRGLQSRWCELRASSTLVPQSGCPLRTTVPHGSVSGGKGVGLRLVLRGLRKLSALCRVA